MKPIVHTTHSDLFTRVGEKMTKKTQDLLTGLCPEGHKLREATLTATDAYLTAFSAYHKSRSPEDYKTMRDLLPAERAASHAWSEYLLRTQAQRTLRTLIRNLSATLSGSSISYRAKTNAKIRELSVRLEKFERAYASR
jgi:hypothetical protein